MIAKNTILILQIILLSLILSGCGTVISLRKSQNVFSEIKLNDEYHKDSDCRYPDPHIYSGVVMDFQTLTFPFSCPCSGESGLAFYAIWPIFIPLSIIDLPFSAVADTIVLPYSIPRQMKYGNITDTCKHLK